MRASLRVAASNSHCRLRLGKELRRPTPTALPPTHPMAVLVKGAWSVAWKCHCGVTKLSSSLKRRTPGTVKWVSVIPQAPLGNCDTTSPFPINPVGFTVPRWKEAPGGPGLEASPIRMHNIKKTNCAMNLGSVDKRMLLKARDALAVQPLDWRWELTWQPPTATCTLSSLPKTCHSWRDFFSPLPNSRSIWHNCSCIFSSKCCWRDWPWTSTWCCSCVNWAATWFWCCWCWICWDCNVDSIAVIRCSNSSSRETAWEIHRLILCRQQFLLKLGQCCSNLLINTCLNGLNIGANIADVTSRWNDSRGLRWRLVISPRIMVQNAIGRCNGPPPTGRSCFQHIKGTRWCKDVRPRFGRGLLLINHTHKNVTMLKCVHFIFRTFLSLHFPQNTSTICAFALGLAWTCSPFPLGKQFRQPLLCDTKTKWAHYEGVQWSAI